MPSSQKSKTESQKGTKMKTKTASKKFDMNFSIYIHRLIKNAHPDLGIQKNSMNIMNSFANDLFEKLATEGCRLARYKNRKTLGSSDIQAAISLVLPPSLSIHINEVCAEALSQYKESRQNDIDAKEEEE